MKKLTIIFLFISQICLAQWNPTQLGPGGSWQFIGLTKPSKDSNRVYAIIYLAGSGSTNIRLIGKTYGQQTLFTLKSFTIQPSGNEVHEPIGPTLVTYGDDRILTSSFDTNNDGYNELLDQSNNRIRIYDGWSGGDPIFQEDCVTDHSKVKIVDMDNDGRAELIFTKPTGLPFVAFTPAIVSAINSENLIAPDYNLKQNYPNPFNPSTTIEYDLKKKANVKLIISNVLGQQIKTFENEDQSIGSHKIKFDASDFPSGTYFYTLILDGNVDSKKMLFVK